DHLKDHGIIAHRTPPYTPQHNGVSKRRNRTLLDMVRSMLSQTTLQKSFWDYALETAARFLNMVPTKKGCEALVKRNNLTKPDKLKPRSVKCIFIGYPKETIRYYFYYPPENKVLVAQNAKFLKNSLITQEASESLEDLEIIQEEDRHPSIDTNLYHEEDDQEINEPKRDLGEPTNYKAALLDHESEKWLNVINVEKPSIKDNEVWVLVELPPTGKTVGEASYILGIKIYRDRSRRLIGLCQSAYIKKMLKRYCMKNSKRGSIPMQEKLKLSKSQGDSKPAKLKHMQNVPYASAVGSIVYAMRCTRPDVAFAQNVTSRFQQNPCDLYWTTVKNILKYLRNTKDMFLTGYMFILNGGAVDWKSAKQRIFATSSAEAEYIAAYDASKEAVLVRKFISGLGVVPTIEEPISMYCDNTRAIAIANESGITKDEIKVHNRDNHSVSDGLGVDKVRMPVDECDLNNFGVMNAGNDKCDMPVDTGSESVNKESNSECDVDMTDCCMRMEENKSKLMEEPVKSNDDLRRTKFSRVLVEVDADKGFKKAIELQYRDKQHKVKKTVKVVYDWKPTICSHCVVFGYDHKSCKVRTMTEEEITKDKADASLNINKIEYWEADREKEINDKLDGIEGFLDDVLEDDSEAAKNLVANEVNGVASVMVALGLLLARIVMQFRNKFKAAQLEVSQFPHDNDKKNIAADTFDDYNKAVCNEEKLLFQKAKID
nr:hypothetical protein [Tanacetum cinerariifolium]